MFTSLKLLFLAGFLTISTILGIIYRAYVVSECNSVWGGCYQEPITIVTLGATYMSG